MLHDLMMRHWILFIRILLRILAFVFIRDICLQFPFCSISICCCYQGDDNFIKLFGNVSISLISWKSLKEFTNEYTCAYTFVLARLLIALSISSIMIGLFSDFRSTWFNLGRLQGSKNVSISPGSLGRVQGHNIYSSFPEILKIISDYPLHFSIICQDIHISFSFLILFGVFLSSFLCELANGISIFFFFPTA